MLYSVSHYIKTGIFFSFQRDFIAGELSAVWPTKWAWKINPDLIQQNPSVLDWMGNKIDQKKWHQGPVLHYVLFPFLYFKSFKTASYVWLICCHIFLIISMILWYDILFLRSGLHTISTLILYITLWLNFVPLYDTLSMRIGILEFFFFTLSIYTFLKKLKPLSGFLLGLAIMTKFLPILFVPYFALKREFKMVISSSLTVLALIVITQFTLGWEHSVMFSNKHGTYSSVGECQTYYNCAYFEFQSITNLIFRLFCDTPSSAHLSSFWFCTVQHPFIAKWIVKILLYSMIIFYSIYFCVLRKKSDFLWDISMLLILMIGLAPHNHVYFFLFFLIPFSLGLHYWIVFSNSLPRKEKGSDFIVLVISYLLIGVFFPYSILKYLFNLYSLRFIEVYQFYSIPVYGYLILLTWLTTKGFRGKCLLKISNS
ncbi:MAG: DUF2029 domain-containing protein [Deltaproteobacteria bacterium]|nr:DUF2029 domain-containing protein [Deltaproteobacteria bacterium]